MIHAVIAHKAAVIRKITHNGSIFSIILRLLSLELSACLKNLNMG